MCWVGNGLSDGMAKLDLNSTQGNAMVMVLLVVLAPVVQAKCLEWSPLDRVFDLYLPE